MMENPLTLVIVCAAILLGYWFGQLWLSIIFGVALIALLVMPGPVKSEAMQSGPAVRPIIVKRKYVGPESIYPKKMEVRITPPSYGTGMPWHAFSGKGFGEGIGTLLRGLIGKKKEEK